MKNSLKTALSPYGNAKQLQNRFIALREIQKTASKRLYNPLEMEKTLKIAFPTPWKPKNTWKPALQPLGNGKNTENCISNPLEAERWMLKPNSRIVVAFRP